MRTALWMLVLLLCHSVMDAAAIRGKVRLRRKGNFPMENPYINNTFKTKLRFTNWKNVQKFDAVRLKDYGDCTDTIVYLSKIPERYQKQEVPPQEPVKIHIDRATFKPRTLPLIQGGTVEFINDDPVCHDVYSFSLPKPFQTPFIKHQHAFVTFKNPGGVTLHSSVYEDMKGHILVLEHPYYTKPRNDGYYSMRNLRPGIYHITAWHPDFPPVTKEVEINYGETITIDFDMSIMGLPEALTR
jgi:plastocyanin